MQRYEGGGVVRMSNTHTDARILQDQHDIQVEKVAGLKDYQPTNIS